MNAQQLYMAAGKAIRKTRREKVYPVKVREGKPPVMMTHRAGSQKQRGLSSVPFDSLPKDVQREWAEMAWLKKGYAST